MKTMPRKRLTDRDRLRCWEENDGICYLCGIKIKVGERWEVEHPRALELGGLDVPGNRKPAHVACHKPKTADDHVRAAKAKRSKIALLGGKQPKGPPMPGSRRSPWKRKIGGGWERRE